MYMWPLARLLSLTYRMIATFNWRHISGHCYDQLLTTYRVTVMLTYRLHIGSLLCSTTAHKSGHCYIHLSPTYRVTVTFNYRLHAAHRVTVTADHAAHKHPHHDTRVIHAGLSCRLRACLGRSRWSLSPAPGARPRATTVSHR